MGTKKPLSLATKSSAILIVGLSLVLLGLLVHSIAGPAQARATSLTVCPAGPPTCDYAIIQAAVDAAHAGDVIKIATGTYSAVNHDSGWPQIVYIYKDLTLRGGYNSAFDEPPDPYANPTTLDAQGQGRGFYINAPISVTVEGLRITGGDASDLDQQGWQEVGGAGYVRLGTVTFRNNQIFGNIARSGGGLYLQDAQATLSANTFYSNTLAGLAGRGAGLSLLDGNITLDGNTFANNTGGMGAGLALESDEEGSTLTNNTIANNTGSRGGGLYLSNSNAALNGNIITGNTADEGGGGLELSYGSTTLKGNIITGNTAGEDGGGLLVEASLGTIENNTIISNTAGEDGGGLWIWASHEACFSGNTISSNAAQRGGGLYLDDSGLALTNNLISDNRASQAGSGLYVYDSGPRLVHNTIARNGSTHLAWRTVSGGLAAGQGGDGSGLCVVNMAWSDWNSVTLTNTILVGHAVGISVTQDSKVKLEGTLWGAGDWANGTDWVGAGDIITGAHNVWGDPGFVNPASGDYHIGPDSAAIDAGVPCDVRRDIDGDPRPAAWGFDIGADERPDASLHVSQQAWPFVLNPGQTLTYTLHVTSAGTTAASDVQLTDTLPDLQQALKVVASRGDCTANADWGGTATCNLGTMSPGDTAHITLTARVMMALPPRLPWQMHNTAWITATEASHVSHASALLHNCYARLNDDLTTFVNVQDAIDASSQPDDVVKVAGYCAVLNSRAGLRQIASVDKSLTLQGGWNPTFHWRDTARFPATLDARGQGRVLYVVGDVALTIEGLRITGGNARELPYAYPSKGAGGGVYAITATVTLLQSQVFSNTAGDGGGLALVASEATIADSRVFDNSAADDGVVWMWSYGGGLYAVDSRVTLDGNTISGNTADRYGAGLYLDNSDVLLRNSIIYNNTSEGYAGGLFASGNITLTNNTVFSNTAYWASGGMRLGGNVLLDGNLIANNVAQGFSGGGMSVYGEATLNDNVILGNKAQAFGGGVFASINESTWTNNIIADNQADEAGSGLYFIGPTIRLLHNTIARNGGLAGEGVCVREYTDWPAEPWPHYSTVVMTNTIVAGHSLGISVTHGNMARLEATLWGADAWANDVDWAGDGDLVPGAHNVWGDPAFADPGAGDYHLGAGSAAKDRGVDAGVTVDIDGDPRPLFLGYDLGADESTTSLEGTIIITSPSVHAGAPLTYTFVVTNTGAEDVQATVNATLPAQVAAGGTFTWTPVIVAGSAWEQALITALAQDLVEPLPYGMQVTTDRGLTQAYADELAPELIVSKRASARVVRVGERVTYTLAVTNTGDFDLHAAISDTLPPHVTLAQVSGQAAVLPEGVIVWPALLDTGSAWEEQVVVTVAGILSGSLSLAPDEPLHNVLRVNTEEGMASVYTETIHVARGFIYLPLISHNARPPFLTLDKSATPDHDLQNGDTLTYTLSLFGPGLEVRLWDSLPPMVSYVPGSLSGSVTPDAAYDPIAHAIVWQGVLPTDAAQEVSFQVTLGVDGTGSLTLHTPVVNTAWLTSTASGVGVSDSVSVDLVAP